MMERCLPHALVLKDKSMRKTQKVERGNSPRSLAPAWERNCSIGGEW